MRELTQEQVERAGSILLTNWPEICGTPYKAGCIDRIRAAAPFLQLPWDDPNEHEIGMAKDTKDRTGGVARLLLDFVRNRNAVLLPKPVDPRRAAILKAYENFNFQPQEALMDALIEALDAVKP